MQRTKLPQNIETIRYLLRSGEGARALTAIGDRWSFLILRDAFLRNRRFEDLRRRTGAARGTLTARLNALIDHGVLYRVPYGKAPSRLEYRLTEKGLDFYPVALCMWRWEHRWAGEHGLPPRIQHRRCGHDLKPTLSCAHCSEPIQLRDISYSAGPGARHPISPQTGSTRRRKSATVTTHAKGVDTTMFHAVDTVGDRWTALLLAALFFGLHRYDDINSVLGIATNILADRLRLLLSAGVIEQHLYQDKPPRYEYRLTEKGFDLFPFSLALHEWGSRWMPSPHGPSIKMQHTICEHRLRTRLVCGSCGDAIDPYDVEILIDAPPRRKRHQSRGGMGKKPLVRRT
jgi:DNA-binding HxlR family transcriptional regulator